MVQAGFRFWLLFVERLALSAALADLLLARVSDGMLDDDRSVKLKDRVRIGMQDLVSQQNRAALLGPRYQRRWTEGRSAMAD